jgi:flagellar biosynthesis protein FlhB
MADSGLRTEKATPRRLERARKEGNFPSSREFLSAVQFAAFVALTAAFGSAWLGRTTRLTRALFARGFAGELTPAGLVSLVRGVIVPELTPLVAAGAALVALAVFTQLATTRMGISDAKLAPDFKRLNPFARVASLPGQNLPVFIQALLLRPLSGWRCTMRPPRTWIRFSRCLG